MNAPAVPPAGDGAPAPPVSFRGLLKLKRSSLLLTQPLQNVEQSATANYLNNGVLNGVQVWAVRSDYILLQLGPCEVIVQTRPRINNHLLEGMLSDVWVPVVNLRRCRTLGEFNIEHHGEAFRWKEV